MSSRAVGTSDWDGVDDRDDSDGADVQDSSNGADVQDHSEEASDQGVMSIAISRCGPDGPDSAAQPPKNAHDQARSTSRGDQHK